jgi:hypothetical protein
VLHRLVREELRDQIQPAIAEPEAIEDQRHGRRPHADRLAVARVLPVKPVSHADLPTALGDDARMVKIREVGNWYATGSASGLR